MGLIVGIAVVASAGAWLVDGRPSDDPEKEMARVELRDGEISLEQLAEHGEQGVLWADARREDEWKADGLVGSIHVTTLSDENVGDQLIRYQDEIAKVQMMVIYCADVNCGMSHELAEIIKSDYAGLAPEEVWVLHGGLTALRVAGRVGLKGSN